MSMALTQSDGSCLQGAGVATEGWLTPKGTDCNPKDSCALQGQPNPPAPYGHGSAQLCWHVPTVLPYPPGAPRP